MSRITTDEDGDRVILHDDGSYEEVDKGGCFIATAAYGTPFAEEINILREWRDSFLTKHTFGRIFVNFYYKSSPPIADFIRNKKSLRAIVRFLLNPIAKLLKSIYKK